MNTLQNQLIKHRNFVSNLRHTNMTKEGKTMTTQQQNGTTGNISCSTGGQGSNKRYKRTSQELAQDIAKVDELVASGKYNQIEALNAVGLQSSVYHYKKRDNKEAVAKSNKPRKFAHRNRTSNKENYAMRKEMLMKKLEQPVKQAKVIETRSNEVSELQRLKNELAEYKAKYAKLCVEVVEKNVLA